MTQNQKWTAPTISSLRGEDASSLRAIFSSLSAFLAGLDIGVGPAGPAGPAGTSATTGVGTTYTTATGTSANVINTGTATNAVLDFYIPTGPRGDDGYATLNIDGGAPNSVYGGLEVIDSGGI
jgi:hypothetical protein